MAAPSAGAGAARVRCGASAGAAPGPAPSARAGAHRETRSPNRFHAPAAGLAPRGRWRSGRCVLSELVARNATRGSIVASRVEVADGLWGKFRGLMLRPSLDAGAGLWLPDSNGIHMMFMRFPIDAVFLGRLASDGTRPVLSVHAALPPWRGLVPLVRGAKGVIELPVGAIAASGTTVGDAIALEVPRGAVV